jgi:hypothetical protein
LLTSTDSLIISKLFSWFAFFEADIRILLKDSFNEATALSTLLFLRRLVLEIKVFVQFIWIGVQGYLERADFYNKHI